MSLTGLAIECTRVGEDGGEGWIEARFECSSGGRHVFLTARENFSPELDIPSLPEILALVVDDPKALLYTLQLINPLEVADFPFAQRSDMLAALETDLDEALKVCTANVRVDGDLRTPVIFVADTVAAADDGKR